MSEDKEYVKPHNKEEKTKKEEYVSPPPRAGFDEARSESKEYIKESKVTNQEIGDKSYENIDKSEYVDPYKNPSYFTTPKVGIKFYINSYLIISLILSLGYFAGAWYFGLFHLIYTLFSNYTFSWYADYKRYMGGSFSKLFVPFGSVKVASAASLFMDYHQADYRTDWLGNTKVKFSRDIESSLGTFLFIFCLVEIFKYFIFVFLAFASMFFHKSTIKKYNKAVDNNNNY